MSPTRMSKIESAVRTALEFHQALNRHDVAGMMALVSDDCVFESSDPAPDGSVYSGKGAVTHFWEGFFEAHPDARWEIEQTLGLGLHCVVLWRYNWVDADGAERHIRGVDLYQVKGAAISERLSYVKGRYE